MPTYVTEAKLAEVVKKLNERISALVTRTNAGEATEAADVAALKAEDERLNAEIEGLMAPAPEPTSEGKLFYLQDFKSLPGAHKASADGVWYLQANPERVHPTANGALFEIRPGDLEADTNTEMAELTLDPNFKTGEQVWVRDRFRWAEADTANPSWETFHEWHDGGSTGGNYSPAVAAFRYGQQIKLVNGHGSPVYWTGPTVKRGEWCELVYRLLFDSVAGELEAFWNGAPVATFKGLTNNTGLAYLKVGSYRAKGTAGTSALEHALLAIGTTKAAVLAA